MSEVERLTDELCRAIRTSREYAEYKEAYKILPPVPMPVPAAVINAVTGHAILIAASPLSPCAFPINNPSITE